jgi:hypothetical protein
MATTAGNCKVWLGYFHDESQIGVPRLFWAQGIGRRTSDPRDDRDHRSNEGEFHGFENFAIHNPIIKGIDSRYPRGRSVGRSANIEANSQLTSESTLKPAPGPISEPTPELTLKPKPEPTP